MCLPLGKLKPGLLRKRNCLLLTKVKTTSDFQNTNLWHTNVCHSLNIWTPNTPLIHTLFTYSKWNVYLKLHFWPEKWSRRNIFRFLHAQNYIFYFIKMPKIANSVIKITFFAHGGISMKLFVMYVCTYYKCMLNQATNFTHISFLVHKRRVAY